jgi:hypothetical protein
MGRLTRLCGMPGAAFPASVLCGSVRLAVDVHRPPRRVPTEVRRPRGRAGRGPTVAPPPSAVHRRGERRGGMALSPQPRGCHIHHYCYSTYCLPLSRFR